MLKSFENTNYDLILSQALRISGFDFIRDTFIGSLSASTDFSNEQKLGIRLVSMKLQYMGDSVVSADSLLMQILFIKFEDIGLEATQVDALLDVQRVGVINGIIAVCKSIIAEESTRLETLSTMETTLPENWNTPDPDPEPELPEPETETEV